MALCWLAARSSVGYHHRYDERVAHNECWPLNQPPTSAMTAGDLSLDEIAFLAVVVVGGCMMKGEVLRLQVGKCWSDLTTASRP